MIRRIVGIAVSALVLWLIWRRIDAQALEAAIRSSNPAWLIAGLACVIPLTFATAWRFHILARSSVSLWEALRLILSASTLNLFFPSKMGDLAKGWVLARRHAVDGQLAVAIVVLEKLLDMASLLAWGVAALLWVAGIDPWLWFAAALVAALLVLLLLLIGPWPLVASAMRRLGAILPGKLGRAAQSFPEQWANLIQWFWSDRRRASRVITLSLLLWAGHLAQFWLFAHALDASVPFIDNMAFATLSILIGLLPFTMAGIGTRDAAIIFFYQPWLLPSQGALLGVLATMRYLLPAIAGLPYLRDYLPARRAIAR
jgi:uncharacterized protein (TIRG00374 family)